MGISCFDFMAGSTPDRYLPEEIYPLIKSAVLPDTKSCWTPQVAGHYKLPEKHLLHCNQISQKLPDTARCWESLTRLFSDVKI